MEFYIGKYIFRDLFWAEVYILQEFDRNYGICFVKEHLNCIYHLGS